ncbi:hypothetical protein [Pseudalkalibacillus decolorationis]|uniref:hypothetical protein n=1 Tax=Pseudalkalibacillus decolorationis TaxID=163879 RepID=UPI002148A025|nr:hypothetical protein [Pseudalkalibacillus decolorationis]
MYVFLSAEIILEDPYFKSIYHRTLLELAKRNKIKLCVSEIDLVETKSMYKGQLHNVLNVLNRNKVFLQPLIKKDLNELFLLEGIGSYCTQLDDFYSNLVKNKFLTIIPYYSNITPQLVLSSAKNIDSNINKSEYKKSILSLSYAQFLKEKNIHNPIIITPSEKDYETLLNNLKANPNSCSFYSSVKQLFEQNELVQLNKESYDELEFSTKEEQNQYLANLITINFDDTINEECRNYILKHDKNKEDLNSESSNVQNICVLGANSMEVNVYLDTVIVTGYLKIRASTQNNRTIYKSVVPDNTALRPTVGSKEMFLQMEVIVAFSRSLEAESIQISNTQTI